MDRFWDALGKSVIVQAFVTGLIVLAFVYAELFLGGASPALNGALYLTMGFYFGTKSAQIVNHQRKVDLEP